MSARWLIFRLRASSIRGNTMRCGARSARVFRPSRSSPGFAPVGLSPVSSTTGRRAGAGWLAVINMGGRVDSLVVRNGAAHGIFLALASVVGPGDTVLCESLTDHGVIGLANVLGFTLKGLDI